MSFNYGWEKFYLAIRFGLGSSGTVQERLKAVISGVSHLSADNFPDEQNWNEFRELLHETTKHPAQGGEGTIEATTSRMTDEEAEKCLDKAFDIFSDIARAYGRES